MRTSTFFLVVSGVACFGLVGSSWAQVTERVSVNSFSRQANHGADLPSPPSPVVSSDGRFVVFRSYSDNLVPGDVNADHDIFLRDRMLGRTELISRGIGDTPANGSSGLYGIWITPDARLIAFESRANNLVPLDSNGWSDLFVCDRSNDNIERVSVASDGSEGNGRSFYPSMSDDDRFVAFTSEASNLVAGDTNSRYDVFLRDRRAGTTELVSFGMGGGPGNGDSYKPWISGDGRFIAFESDASNLVPLDTNGDWDVFVRDLGAATTTRVSVGPGGLQGDGSSAWCSISFDGRYVSFTSEATNLVASDMNSNRDVFVFDRLSSVTERVSVSTGGAEGNGISDIGSITPDGRFVVFTSNATNLVPGNWNLLKKIFVQDRVAGTMEVVSLSTRGAQPNSSCEHPSISADGRVIAFRSAATTLVSGDTNDQDDVFVHDRAASGFTSLCSPGLEGVIPCPCSNPPSGDQRGCDNSSATGGATLTASGVAYLSMDTLVFTTSGEKPTATSVLLQGTTQLSAGAAYGQGLRCTGGVLKRLYTKAASGGSITVPDFGAGDPPVSVRSEMRGNQINAGESRWYLVFYRDPVVLGGCNSNSTFNATQTGRVTWWP